MNQIQDKANRKSILILLNSLFLFVILCLCSEVILRGFKLKPTITDDISLWSLQRSKINHSDNQVILLGNSRMLTNFSVQKAQKKFPEKEFIQLGILGASPLPVLEDLSRDKHFSGLVILGLWEPDLATVKTDSEDFENNDLSLSWQYVHHYHTSFSINDIFNRKIANFFQERLVITHPFYNLKNNLSNLVRRRSPKEFYVTTDHTRSRAANYSLIDIRLERQRRIKNVKTLHQKQTRLDQKQWLLAAETLATQVKLIERRGGRVVFVYFPISGESEQHINKLYPRERYWNHLTNQLRLETIHYQDYRQLIFDCPDTSHLDKKDKEVFTSNLLYLINP